MSLTMAGAWDKMILKASSTQTLLQFNEKKTSVTVKTSIISQILLVRDVNSRGAAFWVCSCMGKMTKQKVSPRVQGFPQE